MSDKLTPNQRLYVSLYTTYLEAEMQNPSDSMSESLKTLKAIVDAQRMTEETLDFCEHDREVATAFIRRSLLASKI